MRSIHTTLAIDALIRGETVLWIVPGKGNYLLTSTKIETDPEPTFTIIDDR
jgi:hypothetical protein